MGVLTGRLAPVSGGSQGIGRAVVHRLAGDGARVTSGYAHDEDAARQVERAVADAGGRAHGVRADLATDAGVQTLLDGADALLGGLDLLVNNAAAATKPSPIAEIDLDEYARVMAVNTRAVLITMRHAARRMNDGGRIVNLSTLTTIRPFPARPRTQPARVPSRSSPWSPRRSWAPHRRRHRLLCGPDARWITGQNIPVAGGLT